MIEISRLPDTLDAAEANDDFARPRRIRLGQPGTQIDPAPEQGVGDEQANADKGYGSRFHRQMVSS
jgi:hypothetical protein